MTAATARRAAALTLTAGVLAACGGDAPSFNRDVAPIVFEHCAPCHHPGGVAPFSLLDYRSAKKRARQIAIVTGDRFMPPWLPEPVVDYAGERRLSDAEIDVLGRWAEAGAPEGRAEDLPPVPEIEGGWQLGEPDLVVEIPGPYTLPAEGPDVFRNFVVPVAIDGRHWVRAVEFRPANPRVVHHAILQVDRSGSARRLDEREPGPGFSGMYMGESYMPDGQFVGWTPGKTPSPGVPGMAWRLDPDTELVVQLHMPPTGKPEPVALALGLHFAEAAPSVHPFALMLSNEDIDIPPGTTDVWVEDRFELPVAVDALSLYPHAHYLGKEIEAWAELPGGERQWLVKIPDWDFNWQDDFDFAEPLALPAHTRLVMRIRYDNTAANPRNPHAPPRRVRFGYSSSDEMANLLLEVVPRDAAARLALEEAALAARLARNPDSWRPHHSRALLLAEQGRLEEALVHFRRALELRPGEPAVLMGLGTALADLERFDEGLEHLREAVWRDPGHAEAWNNLGITLSLAGRREAAIDAFRRAVAVRGSFAEARANLARFLHEAAREVQQEARYEDAVRLYEEVLELTPNDVASRYNLGVSQVMLGDLEAASESFRRALAVRQDLVSPLLGMAWTLATHPSAEVRRPQRAAVLAELLVELTEGHPAALDALAAAHAASGDFAAAVAAAEAALVAASTGGEAALAEEVRQRLALYRAGKPYRQL